MSRHERRSSLRYIALLLAVIICFCAAPSAEANAAARRCVESGRSVSVQRAIPPRLRYRELLDLRGKGEPTC